MKLLSTIGSEISGTEFETLRAKKPLSPVFGCAPVT
jgi:hypothetical protein